MKPTVNDPQGSTVAQALGTLGFDTVEDVRVGKFIEVKLTASSQAEAEEQIALIGEVLTPDSSRFWDVNDYAPGSVPADL